ncbi:MAG: type II toxin-antitoxin system VapC family toxin [Nitrososphaerales archaeon]
MLVFVDSSALKANYDAGDDYHEQAAELMGKIATRETDVSSFITTDYVLDEAVTLTRFAHSHRRAVELADATLGSKFMRVVYTDEGLFSDGMRIFKQHSDKEWSLTDCVSFAAMKKFGIRTAFTFDAHFRQFGFATIP